MTLLEFWSLNLFHARVFKIGVCNTLLMREEKKTTTSKIFIIIKVITILTVTCMFFIINIIYFHPVHSLPKDNKKVHFTFIYNKIFRLFTFYIQTYVHTHTLHPCIFLTVIIKIAQYLWHGLAVRVTFYSHNLYIYRRELITNK